MRNTFKKTTFLLLALVITLAMFAPTMAIAEESQSANTVMITFNANGGSGTTTRWLTPGEPFGTLPMPSRSNHTFIGWFTTSASSGGQQIHPNTLVPNGNTTYWARWAQHQSTTLTHTGSMMITGMPPLTTDSNWITFNGNTIPANARVLSISVNTGSSTMSGAIVGNNLQVNSTAGGGTLTMPWNGANNSVLNNNQHFTDLPARGTYSIRWNGTVISGTPGNLFDPRPTPAIRGYSNVRLTVHFVVIP
ncbi:MAG: InlB B-repeat-containing protein [Bacteroidales bacterium]|jgi:uncharacterized repeat protein (TIGR02543 family)|nr:InlB B-repeat-containing protein [Bacteroidales bacterium]